MSKKIQLFYLFILLSHFTFAKEIYVSASGSNDNGGTSLEDAVLDLKKGYELSAHNDVIYLDGTAGVIYHPNGVALNKKLTLIGQNNAIVDAKLDDGTINNKIFNYMHQAEGAYLTVENITFLNGNGVFGAGPQQGGGFLVKTNGILTFKNCKFSGHTTPKHGGVFSIQQGTLNFEGCVFDGNNLEGLFNGAVIYAETNLETHITVSECLFTNNSAGSHGGVFGFLFKDHGTETYSKSATIRNSTFYNNTATKSGGVLNDISTGAANIELENVTLFENSTLGNAGNCGGLMLNSATTNYLIENSIIYGNKTFSSGEAISDLSMNDNANITIKATIFGAILNNDRAIIEDVDNPKTSIDEKSVYGSISGATNQDIPELTLTYNTEDGVVSFASDALPVNFAEANLLTGSEDHSFLTDQLGKIRSVSENAIDAGAYQLNGEVTVEEVLADNVAPSDPSAITFSSVTETSFDVSWGASTDDIMFRHYEIQLNDETPIVTSNTSISFSDLVTNTTYAVKVKAIDYNDNTSNVVEASQTTAGLIAPVIPTNLQTANITSVAANISWESSVEAGLIYVIIVGGDEFETSELSYKLEGLEPGTEYSVTLKSKNENGDLSEESLPVIFSTLSYIPQTYYVSASGLLENDGLTLETALPTFISAYNKTFDGDAIVIDGEVEATRSIGIQKNLTIRGINNAVFDAKDVMKFFNFVKAEEGSYLNIENIHFKNANGKFDGGTMQIGGAMLLNSPGIVKISGCTFENNKSSFNGGAIAIQNGEVEITKSVFKGNSTFVEAESSPSGGVINLSAKNNSVSLKIDQSAFINNASAMHAGVLNVETNDANGHSFDISIENSTFYGNQTAIAGGTIFLGSIGVGNLNLTNVTIANNSTLATSGNSGGIRSINEKAVVTINNSLIFDNKASFGTEAELMADLSTNDSPNFTINNSIVGAVMESNVALFSGADFLMGTIVNGDTNSDIPALILNEINADNVVGYAEDAIAVGFGSTNFLTAKPTHGVFLVDQLDNVRRVKDEKVDCGAFQVGNTVNIEEGLIDNEAPSVVANIVFSEVTHNSFIINWDASTDNLFVDHYTIQIGEETPIIVSGTNYNFEELTAETEYAVSIIAVDFIGNASAVTIESIQTIEAPIVYPTPVVPANVKVSSIAQTVATVTWDNPEVEGLTYEVIFGENTYETSEFSYNLEGLTANTNYEVKVLSKNDIEERSLESEVVAFTTLMNEEDIINKDIFVSSTGSNDNDGLTLETAVADLNTAYEMAYNGDVIIIDGQVSHTTYVEMTKRLEIIGQNNATLDAENSTKFFGYFDMNKTASLTLENIKFINGNGIVGDTVAQVGGVFSMNTGGTMDIRNCTFENNSTSKPGGAIALQGGTLNIYSSAIIGNSIFKEGNVNPNGGAILVNSGGGEVNLNIYQTLIKDNVSANHGGAMIIEAVSDNPANVFIQNSTIYNNGTENAGGAIFGAGSATGQLIIENSTIVNNYTNNNAINSAGVRIVNTKLAVTINNSIVFSNKCDFESETALISDLSFKKGVNAVVNSSIVGTMAVANNNAAFTGDGRTIFGTITANVEADVPSLSLNEINADGVVGFSESSMAAGFAKVEFYTRNPAYNYMVDQLNFVRITDNGRIDCGAYQLDGFIDVGDLVNDNEAPTSPSNITFPLVTTNAITLNWDASTDDVAISHYLISINEEDPITVVVPEYTFTDLDELTVYSFSILAVDYVGHESEIATAEKETDGIRTPLVPTNVTVSNITATTAVVTWGIGNPAGLTYVVSLQGEWFETSETSLVLTELDNNREYSVTIFTKNQEGDPSDETEAVFFTTLADDVISSIDPNQIQFNAYPNPSSQEMKIKVGLKQYDVEVYDLSGKKVYSLGDVNQDFQLKLKTGVYILRIISNDHILTKRIVFN